MSKLRLNLENLCVETFATEASQTRRGTVVGASGYSECTCPGYFTCDEGCSDACTNGCPPLTNELRTCQVCPHEY